MTAPVAGIDPHQDTYTIGVVDPNGVTTNDHADWAGATLTC